jgi:hypothetical protein
MKTHRTLLIALLGILPAIAWSANEGRPAARTSVEFFEPLKFTDVRDRYMGDPDGAAYLPQIREYVLERAQRYVAEGQTLKVTFTDIDMAGDFEPWRSPSMNDVRIVKDIYPPRINLTFQLTDAEGRVIKTGQRELRDMAFLMKITMAFRNDPLRHEKALLDDWLSSEFPRPHKS